MLCCTGKSHISYYQLYHQWINDQCLLANASGRMKWLLVCVYIGMIRWHCVNAPPALCEESAFSCTMFCSIMPIHWASFARQNLSVPQHQLLSVSVHQYWSVLWTERVSLACKTTTGPGWSTVWKMQLKLLKLASLSTCLIVYACQELLNGLVCTLLQICYAPCGRVRCWSHSCARLCLIRWRL